MEPLAILVFVLIWLFSSAAAVKRAGGGAGRGRPQRTPRGDWPPMPGWPPGAPGRPAAAPGRRQARGSHPSEEAPATTARGSADAAGEPADEAVHAAAPAGSIATPLTTAPATAMAPLPAAEDDGLAFEFLDPDRMVSAIVLSEIIGPPRCRRPVSRFFRFPRRNRLYSGGEREDGAERGTDNE